MAGVWLGGRDLRRVDSDAEAEEHPCVETEPARRSVEAGDHVVGELLRTEDLQAAGRPVALPTFRAIRLGSCLG